MKPLLILFFAAFLSYGFQATRESSRPVSYYFCISRSAYSQSAMGKQTVLYTPVYKFEDEKNDISKRTEAWAQYVKEVCENKLGCTSDLNYYTSFDSANEQFNKARAYYGDTSRFILKKIDFK